jgi:GTPase SAR1 family protein
MENSIKELREKFESDIMVACAILKFLGKGEDVRVFKKDARRLSKSIQKDFKNASWDSPRRPKENIGKVKR